MFRIRLFGYLGFLSIVFLFITQPNPDILPQSKDKNINWPEPVFENLTIADGLPENSVHCILQDHLGYMWFGTQNGLVKYDGYSMKVYQLDRDDSLSISNRQVWVIYEDRSGTLWIGTEQGGLNRFDRAKETFTRYRLYPDNSIQENTIKIICEDNSGNLLVGNGTKINLFNPQNRCSKDIYTQDSIIARDVRALIEDRLTGEIFVATKNKLMIYDSEKRMLIEDDDIDSKLELGTINTFYQSIDGSIWIGHSMGMAKFNSLRNTIKYYQLNKSDKDSSENNTLCLTEDKNGFIWGDNGQYDDWTAKSLFCFDPQKEQFKGFDHNEKNNRNLSSYQIWSLYTDNSGVIWVGTFGGGINKWNRIKDKFQHFSYDSDGEHFNGVFTILEDKQGLIWIDTHNGFYRFDRHTKEVRKYRYDTNGKKNTTGILYMDEDGNICCKTDTKGFGKFDSENGSFHFYKNNSIKSLLFNGNCFLSESSGVLWVGTWGDGLYRFDINTKKVTQFRHDPGIPHSLTSNQIDCLYKDRRGNLWIGTNNGGLNLFDRTDNNFESFKIEDNITSTILTIYEDHKENLWVGTFQTGLYLFDRDNGKPVYNVAVKDGLTYNTIRSILEDDNGNLWISTNYGLSKFDPETRHIRNYHASDVFEENRYYRNSACKTSKGEMLFGSWEGFIMFHPDSIKDDSVPPQIVISNVSLFNRPSEKLKTDGFISEIKELNLSYDENDLRFEYVGLHFGNPSKNQYRYILEGYDNDWVDAGTQRNATYTNLDAGEYTFRVMACNADGVWNKEGASIRIIIPPPFWAKWWAYALYILVGLGLLYSIRRYELNRTQLKNKLKLDEVKLKEREQIDKMKSRFFANISHEFRTPLTLILGPIEKILSQSAEDDTQKQAGLVKRNAIRLLGLINQLLDLSKLEDGKLGLKASKANIVAFIKGISMSFESMAERKDITLKVKSEKDEIELYFDKEKMTKIITNLLSNAFKFTPEDGQIIVSVNEAGNDSMTVKVRDTGMGISEKELPKLFDRFYQVDSSQTREHEGTGIGLALTKELVELHSGTISVESKLGGWTEFTVTLPLGRKHFKDEEIVKEEKTTDEIILNVVEDLNDFDKIDASLRTFQNKSENNNDKNIILIVEDNRDVREFIIDSLGNEFQVEEASNGEMGVGKAQQIIPDLIISDIMMPKMDGNELTRRIKNDERTSHIPVILLTAKSEQESRLEGLETGADDYLTKPFDTKELQIRIKNLIDIRRRLQEKIKSGSILQRKSEKKLSTLDENFLLKVLKTAEEHLSEEEFSIEEFGKEAGMSRTNFHRKLKALTGKSPSLYLRSVRLAKAKEMIEDRKGNISEVAYSVGFSSPVYFSKCFKEEFGFPPSDLVH